MISNNPKDANHLYRKGWFWYWQIYHSGYGMAGGRAFTRKGAIRAAREAIADLVTND